MNPAIYIAIFLPIVIALIMQNNAKKVASILLGKKEGMHMKSVLERNIGRKCRITVVGSNTVEGIIHKVEDTAVAILTNPKKEKVVYYNIALISNLFIREPKQS